MSSVSALSNYTLQYSVWGRRERPDKPMMHPDLIIRPEGTYSLFIFLLNVYVNLCNVCTVGLPKLFMIKKCNTFIKFYKKICHYKFNLISWWNNYFTFWQIGGKFVQINSYENIHFFRKKLSMKVHIKLNLQWGISRLYENVWIRSYKFANRLPKHLIVFYKLNWWKK